MVSFRVSGAGSDNNHAHPDTKIVSEYDQEIPQSQTADNPVAPRGYKHETW